MKFEPTWKSIPTVQMTRQILRKYLKLEEKMIKKTRSILTSFHLELAGYADLINDIHAVGEQWSSGILWPERTRVALDPFNKVYSGNDLDWVEARIGPRLPRSAEFHVPPVTGKLGCSLEGAGKRRIFAIGNYINQRLLRPIHDWVASIFRRLPSDGTLNQEKPLGRLYGFGFYSCDRNEANDVPKPNEKADLVFRDYPRAEMRDYRSLIGSLKS
ncbi:hypothetical protein Syun_031853 [Stephania yunnanensis]|uniref:Uncharacterized protein n=1 Tax=Stephania yunnanensis TaxID=152371 RepID=A0AAP0DWT3_9MAGN